MGSRWFKDKREMSLSSSSFLLFSPSLSSAALVEAQEKKDAEERARKEVLLNIYIYIFRLIQQIVWLFDCSLILIFISIIARRTNKKGSGRKSKTRCKYI